VRVIPDIATLLTSAEEESLMFRAKQYAACRIAENPVSVWFLQGTDCLSADSRLMHAGSVRDLLHGGVYCGLDGVLISSLYSDPGV